jgi:hypothetical protein
MTLLTWDGERLPNELRGLPPGKYAIERVEEARTLTDEEEAGIEAALESMRRGDLIDGDDAGKRLRASLR